MLSYVKKEDARMNVEQAYTTYKPLLYAIAYRMLGSRTDAEEMVQDVLADYSLQPEADIRNEKAYLSRMVTNRCLNMVQSARARREVYVGSWLPEPEVSLLADSDPAEQFARREELSYAVLVMLEQLSPVERAVFVLRESLEYDYEEIADILQKSAANCRKILSRAKEKLQEKRSALPHNDRRAEPLAAAFIEAIQSGRFDGLTRLLTEDAILVSDGGGKVRAAIRPILGRSRVSTFLQGVIPRGFLGDGCKPATINGQLGFVMLENDRIIRVITFQLDERGEQLDRIFIMMNPDKLPELSLL
jgi:RNA polymerase sigma-70 factor (ECF subfamily)